jgi:hypothetical protein
LSLKQIKFHLSRRVNHSRFSFKKSYVGQETVCYCWLEDRLVFGYRSDPLNGLLW